tara:strand:+ start:1006 stop:1290 length:285 start_codon:yes stop_codon:yes gene_type:complete
MKRERILKPSWKQENYVEPLEERMKKINVVLNRIKDAAMKHEQNRIYDALMKLQQDPEAKVFEKLAFPDLLINKITAQILEELEEERDEWMMII